MADKKMLLLVDSRRISRLMIRAMVEHNSDDWSVQEAKSGKEAIALAGTTGFAVIMLDAGMIGEDAMTLAPRLQAACPTARVVLLTGSLDGTMKAPVGNPGLQLIPKPITEGKILDFLGV